jgi:hypothetical protein
MAYGQSGGWLPRLQKTPEHSPLKFAAELSQKLATRSRHVCLFLGAGSSRACGLPDITQLRDRVMDQLGPADQVALGIQLEGRNLEAALSRLRRIAALLWGDAQVDGLTAAAATALDAAICEAIVREIDIEAADLEPVYRLAAWAARAGYRLPLEIFTVNYDLSLETALERLRVPSTHRGTQRRRDTPSSRQSKRVCYRSLFCEER